MSGRAAVFCLAALAACSLKVRDGGPTGSFPCEESSTCPAPDSACLLSMCLDEQCVFVPAPEGPLPQQRPGDCREVFCDGSGAAVTTPAPADVPPDDGNPCTESACDGDAPRAVAAAAGSACGGNGLCNGAGKCGVCLPSKKRCEGEGVSTCGAEGQWSEASACSVAQPVCADGVCVGVAEVAAGAAHACVRFDDGSLRCWGDDSNGQLGRGGIDSAEVPVWASGMRAVAFGPAHACGLRFDDTVWCWGAGAFGQLGDGQRVASPSPVATNVAAVAVAVGDEHSCALTAGGTVQCWGRNDHGQLGSGRRVQVELPLAPPGEDGAASPPEVVPGVSDAKALVLDHLHTCISREGGAMACWGLTPYGEGGDASDLDPAEVAKASSATPAPVGGVAGAVQLACAGHSCCARLGDGSVSCWGSGAEGALGHGATSDSFAPVAVKGLAGASHIALGRGFGCALTTERSVACWGSNAAGQLGTASDKPHDGARTIATLGPARQLAVGDRFACALLVSGELHCWGAGSGNQPRPVSWPAAG